VENSNIQHDILIVDILMRKERLTLGNFNFEALLNPISGLPIMFLHGYSFTSRVWRDIDALGLLDEERVPYAALDMPYGIRSGCSPKTRDPKASISLIRHVLDKIFEQQKAVIVGASLGGYMALKYSASQPVSGLLLVAPVNSLGKDLVQSYKDLNIPVHIIYGSKDKTVSLQEMEDLSSKITNCKLRVYSGASHPAYLDQPEDFKNDLLKTYKESRLA